MPTTEAKQNGVFKRRRKRSWIQMHLHGGRAPPASRGRLPSEYGSQTCTTSTVPCHQQEPSHYTALVGEAMPGE